MHKIVQKVEKHNIPIVSKNKYLKFIKHYLFLLTIIFHGEFFNYNIPHSLILNADQTPLKYVTVWRSTLGEKNVKDVPISGSADKRSITATFAETLDGFLAFLIDL